MKWFANIDHPQSRKAYRADMRFVGIRRPEEFRLVTRAHFSAWRRNLEQRGLSTPTIRRELSALSPLFSRLCDSNTAHPQSGPGCEAFEVGNGGSKTPAIGDGRSSPHFFFTGFGATSFASLK